MHRLVLALAALLLLPVTARAAIVCPVTRDGQSLRGAQLYDGPLEERAILRPEQRGRRVRWEVAYIREAGRRGILLCFYDGAARPVEVEVPPGVRECAYTLARDERTSGAVDCR